ncbi:GspE/PulE family protein [Planctomycetaceae bacterium]|jgi:general secretion pathway protein E|nr:GspE/PulE family protein [Planctomycetaceae bacterium]MDC0307728.1 GspE/PulE family protein [Planctomycetaceae bacterium]
MYRTFMLFFVFGTIAASSAVFAQDAIPSTNTTQPATTVASSTTAPNQFTQDPRPFQRGNTPIVPNELSSVFGISQMPINRLGWYYDLIGMVMIIGLFFLWVHTTEWVDEDARSLKIGSLFWNGVMISSGFVGFLLVFMMPNFLLGLIVLLGCYVTPFGFYVKEHNERVPASSRIFTQQHLKGVAYRMLAKVGIQLGKSEGYSAATGPPIEFLGKSDGKAGEVNHSKQVMKSKGYMGAKELVYDAVMRRATDIHLEPKEDEMSVRIRIDGVMYPSEPFDRSIGESIVNIFKVLAAMDITEKRRPQDGSFRAVVEYEREIDFRSATQGTRHGEKLTLRLLDQTNSVASLDKMGMRKKVLGDLRGIVHQPHGLMLVCGPTGAGKSTTLYSCLNDIDSYQSNVITVEDPVEYKMDNVNQIEINQRAGQSFATSLRSILRQDPDVVMIGEIRDVETAEVACQAANTGHMVFSTIHANDTITALFRMMELGLEPFMVANSVSAILGQRLARRLCPDCKQAYKPKAEVLKAAGLPVDKVEHLYRPPKNPEIVCETCGGLGYRGRVGVFELLVVTDRMRDLIRERANVSVIKSEARKNGMLYMREEGLRLAAMGVTSVEEMMRVVK